MKRIHVFDLDGTLVDSMGYFGAGMVRVLDENGISYPDNIVDIVTPLGYSRTAEYYRDSLGLDMPLDKMISRMQEILVYEYTNNIRLKAGVREYLESLAGDRLFVLTASPHIVTDVCLEKNGVFDKFEQVWSVEDYGIPKTKTELFYEVARRIGCEVGDIMFYDDNLTAITTAKAAGCCVFGVYDRQDAAERERACAVSDRFIDSFCQLL